MKLTDEEIEAITDEMLNEPSILDYMFLDVEDRTYVSACYSSPDGETQPGKLYRVMRDDSGDIELVEMTL